MKHKSAVAVFVGSLFIYAGAVAANENAAVSKGAQSVSIHGLIQEALSKSPSVQAKKAQYEALRSKVIQACLPEDPMAGVNAEGQSRWLDPGTRADNQTMVSQTIPFPTKLILNGVIASKEADMAYQMYKEEEKAVAWRIEQPTFQLFLSKRTVLALQENKALLEQLSNVSKSRYESNAVSQSDYLKTQIELAQNSIEIFDWAQKAHIAEAALSRQLDKPLETQYPIEEKAGRVPFSFSLEELGQTALEKRPELMSALSALERAKASRSLSRTEWLPDITGRLETRKYRGAGDIRDYDNFIGISVPVWSLLKGAGGGWKSAEEEVRSAEAVYNDMKNEVLFTIREAYAKFKSAENALTTYESLILPQAKQQVDISLSSYEAGKTDILDLIDAQRTLKKSQIGYYKAMSDHEMALSDLKLAVGDELDKK